MSSERPLKRKLSNCSARDGNGSNSNSDSQKVYKFQIQLSDGWTTRLTLQDPPERMQVSEFISHIRKKLEHASNGSGSTPESGFNKREIRWNPHMYLEDAFGKKIASAVLFSRFRPNKCHLLILHEDFEDSIDRSYKVAVQALQNMWDLTAYKEMHEELPMDYTFETALADLIDNSLKAVWLNAHGEKRFIGVTIEKNKIDIFDSGCGLDGTDDNSIAKWGNMGPLNQRVDEASSNPPYLQPFFGVFGYSGPIAAMHLGRNATVSSKSKQFPKVYKMHLSRDSMLRKSLSVSTWKMDGGIRNPLEDEKALSPHGSFTWVEISNLRIKCPDIHKLQCLLKDIYFPYIQHDEAVNSNKTVTPVEFLVNDVNLAEISGGEMARSYLHSCNGPDFVLQLSFSLKTEEESLTRVANARLKFVYFPIVEGQERIEEMLKKLKKDGFNIKEQFENFSRVSIRRLGRLLPAARWKQLPLLDFSKHKIGKEALSLKRCSRRVKCFIDTDAGFHPTPLKTELAHQDPFTLVLKNFGSKPISSNEAYQDVSIYIHRNGTKLGALQLERDYIEWVRQMHEQYDQEIKCGEDEPTVILSPLGKRKLGITQDVIRVHRAIKWMGKSWKSGQKVKILKGAIGTLKESMYATLEYIIVEGLEGDAGGEVRLICRPIDITDDQGCKIADANGENPAIEIQKSVSFPISFIDEEKIVAVGQDVFHSQLEKILTEKSAKWKICHSTPLSVRVGGCLPSISVICSDSFGNYVPFGPISQIKLSIYCEDHVVLEFKNLEIEVPDGGSSFTISDFRVESSMLDKIRKHSYNAKIEVTSLDGRYSLATPCKVLPGSPDHVKLPGAQLEKCLAPGTVIEELVLEIFDSFENHIEEGTEVTINVDNLSFQDNFGSLRKVNSDGCVDLSGLLKVDASYGSAVQLSVSTEGRDIFKGTFNVPRKEIQAISEVFFPRSSGLKLRYVLFEVVDSYGTIVDQLVHITQVPKIELGSPHTPKRPYQYCQLASSPMSCWSNESFQAYLRHTQKLEQEVEKIGLTVGCLERSASELLDKKKNLENDISILKAKLGNSYERHINTLVRTKETMKQEIEQLCQGTMASVLVEFSKRPIPNFNLKNELKADCDDLVALLATVTDPKLGRVLAKYLGEDLMLSVVCDTDGPRSFVQYDSNGEINKTCGIYRVASILGININKPFCVIDLDKIRPSVGDLTNEDVQKKLAIPRPYSPQHQTSPEGFVGYAVNMLNFTTKRLGLRATLFYQLFGQLQVYRTRYDIERAHDYIKEGAVSLDGAIMRSNGIFSHGDTNEPKITFAVVEPLSQGTSDENVVDIITQIKKKNDILENLQPAYQRVLQMQHDVLKEYKSKYDHLQMIVQSKSLETSVINSDLCK